MEDDAEDVELVARQMLAQHRHRAIGFTREQAEIAAELGDMISAKAWRDIADAIERIQNA